MYTVRHVKLSLLASLISAFCWSHTAFAAAFQLYELGTPIVGTAAVGQAAVAADASTAYFNPAGMATLRNSQFMLGSQLLLPRVNFSKNSSTSISGDNGGNAGMLTPGMNLYYIYSYRPQLKFGISLTSPYGGSLTYDDGWVGRYIAQGSTFYTINLNPSVAYCLNPWTSIGAGISLEYINLQQTVAFPIAGVADGQVKVSAANVAPGFNLGLMFTPYSTTKIGVAYRSQISHDLHGNATFLRIDTTPKVSTKMVMPHNIIMSLAQNFRQLTILGELGWANWASMRNTILHATDLSVVTPMHWNNTYRVGLGGQYNLSPCLLIQTGISYDSSPTASSKRLPDLPMDRQIRFGTGVMYTVVNHVVLGASYEYWNLGAASINNHSYAGTLSGTYARNYANTLQVSLNVEV